MGITIQDGEGNSSSLWTRTWTRHVVQRAEKCQHWFTENVLREKPLPPSKNGRCIPLRAAQDKPLVDERRGHGYISNTIRSSRYTLWDFLPKQIIWQATRMHNFYFLCIGVPQTIPGLSTTGNFTTILPLGFFILLTIIKEGYDDFKRHRLDKVENQYWALVLKAEEHSASKAPHAGHELPSDRSLLRTIPTAFPWRSKTPTQDVIELKEQDEDDLYSWSMTRWHNIKVGDILRLKRDDPVPADIVLLHTTGEHGVAFIETMALDGETNLKTKQAIPDLLESCGRVRDIKHCQAEFTIEDPNKDLYNFNGRVAINEKSLPLTLNNVCFRGSVLRNTGCVYGLVVNSGEECKIRMNANHHPEAKKPRLEKYANQVVLTLIFYVVVLSVGCSMGYLLWHNRFEAGAWYLENGAPAFKQIIVGFLIMFNNVIPLALYVSLEIVKIGQAMMVQSDVEMFDEETNTPMICNTNTILENLGQVSYILSDKTGTLTENVMKFKGMSIGGIVWRHGRDEEQTPEKQNGPGISNEKPDRMFKVEAHEVAELGKHETSPPRASHALSRPSQALSRRTTGPVMHTERMTEELLDIIQRDPTSTIACQAHQYLLALAVCHTALPETKDGGIDFQASSPDEVALVRAAQELGYLLINRSSQTIELLISSQDGKHHREVYEILEVVEFSSKRKRMTIVLRCPDSRIWLICKGADSAIIPRLRQSDLACRKSKEVRRSMEVGRHLIRKSEQHEPRNSFGVRPSLHLRGRSSMDVRPSMAIGRVTLEIPRPSHDVRHSLQQDLANLQQLDDSELFTRCFHHLDDFATEGLRTLLFAHKYLDDEEYHSWSKTYREATTSLVDRQELIEAAGDVVEQGLDLLGASAIEDKLQKGVPETIDRLQRANIKVWMLTGDKRETAINIAHSARICKPASLTYILDSTKGDLHGQMQEIVHDGDSHRVLVIDGHTLSIVQADGQLTNLFFTTLIANIDSVIVCRASPAQKADIVFGIRARLPGLTLAIGDGANDIAMIQAAHVGIGISGKEGLQAARVADYSIAQFRFLQRLLLVHGRYQYVRTAKFILMTFWKEFYFYLMQAYYQRYNGYTGTSLYESWSLTALNTLFTSLCVIVPGIFEQDLRPTTLLAIPELYVFGQRNLGLNLSMYFTWMFHAAVNGTIVWFIVWAGYGHSTMSDNGLFAIGVLAFTLGIVWTNWKLLAVEAVYKTAVVYGSLVITVGGWFAWTGFMSAVYSNNLSPYDVKGGFRYTFGRDPNWWLTLFLALAVLVSLEIAYGALKRQLIGARMWPPWKFTKTYRNNNANAEDLEIELWQEMERDPKIKEHLRRMAEGLDGGEEDDEELEDVIAEVASAERAESEKRKWFFWQRWRGD